MNKKSKELPYRPCVGIMVINEHNKVWAGHRLVTTARELTKTSKRWQMPQGGIDKGEEPYDAAKRELWEETGMVNVSLLEKIDEPIDYDLPKELVGIALKGKYKGQRMHWFAFRFEGDDKEINISNPPDGAPVEFDQWKWLEMQELPELIVSWKRELYTKVVNNFQHLVA